MIWFWRACGLGLVLDWSQFGFGFGLGRGCPFSIMLSYMFSPGLCQDNLYSECLIFLSFQECSVFMFDKKTADKLHKPRRREIVTETLKRDVKLLCQLRHPKILKVIHQLEECK